MVAAVDGIWPCFLKAIALLAITLTARVSTADAECIRIYQRVQDVMPPGVSFTDFTCNAEGPDECTDLTLKLQTTEIAAALGGVVDGDVVPLTFTGNLLDGTDILGTDCVWIRGEKAEPHVLGEYRVVLYPARSNPFNPTTRIAFSLPADAFVDLSIYDVTGRRVDQIVSEWVPKGAHAVEWDAGAFLRGIYFDRLGVASHTETGKLILLT